VRLTRFPPIGLLNPSSGLRKTKLLVPILLICLAIPSLPRGDSEEKEPAVAPGIQRERVNLILIDVIVTDRKEIALKTCARRSSVSGWTYTLIPSSRWSCCA
jgi:hypothetical protein